MAFQLSVYPVKQIQPFGSDAIFPFNLWNPFRGFNPGSGMGGSLYISSGIYRY
jgi:hypothetical protein